MPQFLKNSSGDTAFVVLDPEEYKRLGAIAGTLEIALDDLVTA